MIVSVSPEIDVLIPVPPAIVNVSVVVLAAVEPVSAAIVSQIFWSTLGELFVIVIVSVVAFVVIVIPVPSAKVKVSVVESATTSDWPLTAIVWKRFWSTLGASLVIVNVSPDTAVDIPVPPAIVRVSVAISAVVEPLSPTIDSNTFCDELNCCQLPFS